MKYLNVKWVDGVAVVGPKGSLTGLSGGEETDALDEVLTQMNQDGVRRVVVDLGAINFMATLALAVLIKAHKRFAERGARIVLCHLGDHVHHVFLITKLAMVFDIHETLRDALEDLRRWQDAGEAARPATASGAEGGDSAGLGRAPA